ENSTSKKRKGDFARPSRRPMPDNAPLFCRPAASTNMDATVIVAGLLKPLTACSGVTSPATARPPSTSRATVSMRSFSVANNTIAARAMHNTSTISMVIPRFPESDGASYRLWQGPPYLQRSYVRPRLVEHLRRLYRFLQPCAASPMAFANNRAPLVL